MASIKTAGLGFNPSGARAGQNSAWGRPAWSHRRPSDEAASRTLNPTAVAARLRASDPPDVSQMPNFRVDLRPTI